MALSEYINLPTVSPSNDATVEIVRKLSGESRPGYKKMRGMKNGFASNLDRFTGFSDIFLRDIIAEPYGI